MGVSEPVRQPQQVWSRQQSAGATPTPSISPPMAGTCPSTSPPMWTAPNQSPNVSWSGEVTTLIRLRPSPFCYRLLYMAAIPYIALIVSFTPLSWSAVNRLCSCSIYPSSVEKCTIYRSMFNFRCLSLKQIVHFSSFNGSLVKLFQEELSSGLDKMWER